MDLRDDGRLEALCDEARRLKLVTGSEADTLKVFSAAEHALAKGRNPGAVFVTVLKRKLWHFSSQADEERARRRLVRLRDEVAVPLAIVPSMQPRRSQAKADDAKLARIIHSVALQRRVPAAVLIRELRPSWTLEYYELARRGLISEQTSPLHLIGESSASGANRGQGGSVGEEAPVYPRSRTLTPICGV